MLRHLFILTLFIPAVLFAQTPCEEGFAGIYPCDKVDLLYHFPMDSIGDSISLNDSWGWEFEGRTFALVGRFSGTSFIEITEPLHPIYLGNLPAYDASSNWRDIKVYEDHAFVVSESNEQGIQVFDLTQLLDVENPPIEFVETAHYDLFGSAHNIAINEDSGYAYGLGTNTFEGSLHIVNIQDPINPEIAGGYNGSYIHDAQVVNYAGPDADYSGHEIAFACCESFIEIIDVEDKLDVVSIATSSYSDSDYVHQGWLTEDQRFFVVNDEGDEIEFGNATRTHIFDVQDLDSPQYLGFYESEKYATDHNLYVKGDSIYQANNLSGLQILRSNNMAELDIEEVAFFDTEAELDSAGYGGAWNAYPFYSNGLITVTSKYNGFFILELQASVDTTETVVEEDFYNRADLNIYPNPASGWVFVETDTRTNHEEPVVINSVGQFVENITMHFESGKWQLNFNHLPSGIYVIRFQNQQGRVVIN